MIRMKSSLFLFSVVFTFAYASTPCNVRTIDTDKSVCVCNATYCDTVPAIDDSLSSGQYQWYTSIRGSLGFDSTTGDFESTTGDNGAQYQIVVNVSDIKQTIIGFGGAFTDSTGFNILNLPEDAQSKLLESYFSDDGISYSLCRVPVSGTDFSNRFYTYCDEEDPSLEQFALQPEDFLYKIPLIQKAQELRNDNVLNLFASSWSSPIWMKSKNSTYGGELKPEYYQLWADYFVKFFENYRDNNITFWGLTTQNEPYAGFLPGTVSKINSVAWYPWNINKWVSENLGPTIRNSSFSDVKIMLHDDQRLLLPILYLLSLNNENVLNYVDGVAIHFYMDSYIPAWFLQFAKSPKKDLFLLPTEACAGATHKFLGGLAVDLGSWDRLELYLSSIMSDLEYGAAGFVDWNMALNTSGGPTYIENTVDSPIIVNASAAEFYKQPMFYLMGHFSKFVVPDSVRLQTTISPDTSNVKTVAFQRPDNKVSVFIYNGNSVEEQVGIEISGKTGTFKVEPYSVNTILYSL